MAGALRLTPKLGTSAACRAMGLGRGEPQRQRSRAHRRAFVGPPRFAPHRPCPPLALDAQEQQAVLDTLNSERFCDTAPAAVHATLLGEGTYVGSVRYPSTGCWPPMPPMPTTIRGESPHQQTTPPHTKFMPVVSQSH